MRHHRRPFVLTLTGLFTGIVFIIIVLFQLELEAFLAYRQTSYKNMMMRVMNLVDPHPDDGTGGHTDSEYLDLDADPHMQSERLTDQTPEQKLVDYIAANLYCRYDVITNVKADVEQYEARISLTNTGTEAIQKGEWAIYFSHQRMIDFDKLKPRTTGLVISHVDGYLFKMSPYENFEGFEPNKTIAIALFSSGSSVAKTDVFPNWYVTATHARPKVIRSTRGEELSFVGPFDSKEKWGRFEWDRYEPYTSKQRYDVNDVSDMGVAPIHVIPTPKYINVNPQEGVTLSDQWKIVAEDSLLNEATYLSGKLGMIIVSKKPVDKFIVLQIGDITINNEPTHDREAYSLKVDPHSKAINIMGSSKAGLFYGVQTLLSLKTDSEVPETNIDDVPRFGYRGLHLDVGRNFLGKEYIFKLLDTMAMYKLNKFHFHLSDDEGWRLQIPGLDELTEVAGKRCHDLTRSSCLLPQLGSGPEPNDSGSGFYTVATYREILKYAHTRHIQVIPEIDMPGHSQAAISAMRARYDHLNEANDTQGARRYLLTDLEDTTSYLSGQMFADNAINPCINSTYTFIEHVVSELIKMHGDIQPLTVFHYGGDEVAQEAWTDSPACDKLRNEHDEIKTNKDLKFYFTLRVADITNAKGLDLAAWEDGVMGENEVHFNRTEIVNARVITNAWNNIWESGMANNAYRLANEGYEVVLSLATHFYFDHPQEADPSERGNYWATRKTETRKVFGFIPDNVYANADATSPGDPMTEETLCYIYTDCYSLKRTENMLGIQAQLWTEMVRTTAQADAMLFPRLLAFAERAWHKAHWENVKESSERDRHRNKNWQEFANTLGYKELSRLEAMDVHYRVPPPGGTTDAGVLRVNVEFPGLTVQYSTDDGRTWTDFPEDVLVKPSGPVVVRTRSHDGNRFSRIVRVSNDDRM